MESLQLLLDGFATAATPVNPLFALIGVIVGTAVGVLPGVGPAMTTALLLPITYNLEPTGAIIMLAGIFYGGMYGGSTTSILLNTPGESSSVVTAIEGNLMAKGGRAAQALATAALGSWVAGTIGTLLLAFFAPIVTRFAISLGAPEYFAVMLLAFIAVTADSEVHGCAASSRWRSDSPSVWWDWTPSVARPGSPCLPGWPAAPASPRRLAAGSSTWGVHAVPTQVRGAALVMRLTGNRVGQVAVPAAAGAVAGVAATFWLTAALLGAAACGAWDEVTRMPIAAIGQLALRSSPAPRLRRSARRGTADGRCR
jgi:hypothetical protein